MRKTHIASTDAALEVNEGTTYKKHTRHTYLRVQHKELYTVQTCTSDHPQQFILVSGHSQQNIPLRQKITSIVLCVETGYGTFALCAEEQTRAKGRPNETEVEHK